MIVVEYESNEDMEDSDQNFVEFETKFQKNILLQNIKIHCIPDKWNNPAPSKDKNLPPFDKIDNPGDWSSF